MEIGDKKGEAAVYRNLATLFKKLDDKFDKTQEYHEKALAIRKSRSSGLWNLNIGTVFKDYLVNLEWLKNISGKHPRLEWKLVTKEGEVTDNGNLKTVFQLLGKIDKAP
ncbi:unnamed protein product [Pocillopora meandrina]|uniref:Tetratricopeptide repeat protein n=1 Tax=Pocillopora meandrina TaxID=46732 RepID=A0AAU9VTZ8_9CNID|nr:unnamed protein product [Pocillopora meandrina]